MNDDNNKRDRLIISENKSQNQRHRTTEARSQLYRLIARFRKDAENADDPRTRTIFAFAAEIITGLARAFRRHEDDANQQNGDRQH